MGQQTRGKFLGMDLAASPDMTPSRSARLRVTILLAAGVIALAGCSFVKRMELGPQSLSVPNGTPSSDTTVTTADMKAWSAQFCEPSQRNGCFQ